MTLGMIGGRSEEKFAYVASKGLKYIELCLHPNFVPDELVENELPAVKALSEKYGLAVGSVGFWGPKPLDEKGEIDEAVMYGYKRAMDFAAGVGSPVFHCGCNPIEGASNLTNCQAAIGVLRRISAYAVSKGMRPSVYNCAWNNFIWGPKQWEIILSAIPELGIKFDPSHCIAHGGDYLAELRDFGDRVNHVHIKGTLLVDGQIYDHPPAGLDSTNWGAIFDMLYTKNYDGMISIEPESKYWKGDRCDRGVDFTLNHIKQFMIL